MFRSILKLALLLLVISIPFSTNTAADDEDIKVSGVTVSILFRAPFDYSKNSSHLYLQLEKDIPPSCYEVRRNLDDFPDFIDGVLSNFSDNCSRSYSSICGTPALVCVIGDVRFTYDSFWVIGEKQLNLQNRDMVDDEIGHMVRMAVGDIQGAYSKFKDSINIPTSDDMDNGEFLTVYSFNDIIPKQLSYVNDTAEGGEYRVVSTPYESDLCTFLNVDPKDCRLNVVEYRYRSNDYYRYYILHSEGLENFYGEILFIDPAVDLYSAGLFENLLASLDYLRYGKDFVEEDYGVALKDTAQLILQDYETIEQDLLKKTNSKHYSLEERLVYLESNRSRILEKKVEEIVEIKARLKLVEDYYRKELNAFSLLPQYKKIGILLYEDEIESHFERLFELTNDIETKIESIKEGKPNTRQIYYSELELARTEQAIKQTHEDNLGALETTHKDSLFTGYLTLLIAIFTIMFTFFLVLMQNTADKYSALLLGELEQDVLKLGGAFIISVLLFFHIYFQNFKIGLFLLFITLILLIDLLLLVAFCRYAVKNMKPHEIIERYKKRAITEVKETVQYGYKVRNNIGILKDIAIKLDPDTAENCINALEEIAVETIGVAKDDNIGVPKDDNITEESTNDILGDICKSIREIGRESAKKDWWDTTNNSVNVIYAIYKKVSEKKRDKISTVDAIFPASVMRVIGETAAKYRLNRAVVIASENIRDIGIDVIASGLSVDKICDELRLLGIKTAENGLNATKNVVWALRDISEKLYGISGSRKLSNDETSILEKNREIVQEIKEIIESNKGQKDILQEVDKARKKIVEWIRFIEKLQNTKEDKTSK